MTRNDGGDDRRDVEPTSPSEEHTGLRPMAPDDPRRLGCGNSVLVFLAPRPPGGPAGDGRAGHYPASDEAGTTARPVCQFWSHFDYGLLREELDWDGASTLYFDRWAPPDLERHRAGHWHHIDFDPFTASMSEIDLDLAKRLIDGGDLYAPTWPSG